MAASDLAADEATRGDGLGAVAAEQGHGAIVEVAASADVAAEDGRGGCHIEQMEFLAQMH